MPCNSVVLARKSVSPGLDQYVRTVNAIIAHISHFKCLYLNWVACGNATTVFRAQMMSNGILCSQSGGRLRPVLRESLGTKHELANQNPFTNLEIENAHFSYQKTRKCFIQQTVYKELSRALF